MNPYTGIATDYSYDEGGNLLQVKEKETVTGTYTYDKKWKDKLIAYNGKKITYDKSGNPKKYLGHTLTWKNGRQLASYDKTKYTYSTKGSRLAKSTKGITTSYILNGSTILSEKTGDEQLYYYYDESGNVVSIGYKKAKDKEVFYSLIRNSAGDVTNIYEAATGNCVGSYSYDAWGAVLSENKTSATSDPNQILEKNPFRYRSYYYDKENKLYYLQSRYNGSVGDY